MAAPAGPVERAIRLTLGVFCGVEFVARGIEVAAQVVGTAGVLGEEEPHTARRRRISSGNGPRRVEVNRLIRHVCEWSCMLAVSGEDVSSPPLLRCFSCSYELHEQEIR